MFNSSPAVPSHIVEGKPSHTLLLIWHLICHYQITDAGSGYKTLLLDWLKTCLADRNITNLTSDWRDGFLLSSLVHFCDSSLIIDHLWLSSDEALENVENAMNIAEERFDIPRIIQHKDFVSMKQDENSIMTYLSYFCSGINSPVQKMLLEWIQEQTDDDSITDFTDCWLDGKKLGHLTQSLSCREIDEDFVGDAIANCKSIMELANQLLGINMTLTAAQFADRALSPIARVIYLMQFYFYKSQAEVRELHVPDESGIGATVWLDIVLPESSTGVVYASVDGKVVGDVPVDVQQFENGQRRIQFNAEFPDIYTLNVNVGNVCIKGSPFLIDLTPPEPSLVQLINTILPKKAGIPVIMTFNTENAGHGELIAMAMGDVSGEMPFSVNQISPYLCKISFIPLEADNYTVDVRMDGQHVKGSPFSIDLGYLIQPELVNIGEPVKNGVGEPVIIPINTSIAGDAKLEVKCSGLKSGKLEVSYDSPKNPTEISFIPPIEDQYSVSIFFDGTEIIGSPVEVSLYPMAPIAKMVRLVCPPSSSLKAKAMVKLGFDTSEAGAGTLAATCFGQKIDEVEVEVQEVSGGDYDVIFTPPEVDIFVINVLWSGQHVPGSPFNMNLIPRDMPDPTMCVILDFPTAANLMLTREPVTFKVDTRKAGKGFLDVVIEVSKGINRKEDDQISMLSSVTRDSDAISRMTAMEAEEKELVMPMEEDEGEHAEEGHMQIRVTNRMDRSMEGSTKTIENEEMDGVQPDEEMTDDALVLDDDEDSPKLTIDPTQESSEIFLVTYVPVRGGMHAVHVYWSDMPIPNTPLFLKIVKPQIAFYNDPVSVVVHTMFKRKNLKTRIQQSDGTVIKGLKVKMGKAKTGHYFLVFSPPQPDVYLLHVTAKGKPLATSPYVISYLKPNIPSELLVYLSQFTDQAYVGHQFSFTIKVNDNVDLMDNVKVTRRPSAPGEMSSLVQDGEEVISVHLERNKDGSMQAAYTPSIAGEEMLEVRFGYKPIPGSPFMVTVLDVEDEVGLSPTVEASAIGTEDGKEKHKKKKKDNIFGMNLNDYRFIVGAPHKFKLHCKELGSGELQIMTKPTAFADISITETSEAKTYWVEIIPRKPGKCELIVRYGGTDTAGSPFGVHFLARGNAVKCVLLENSDCPQNPNDLEKMFCVSTKGAGKGKITAVVMSMSTKQNIAVGVEQDSKHHYHLKFIPTEGFNYILTVMFDDVHIAGSPFKMLLGNPSLTKTEGDGLTKPWSGRLNTFYVYSENSGPGNLTVYIESDEDKLFNRSALKVEPKITTLEEFKYEVSYQLQMPGIYWVSVKWNDMHIQDSPFKSLCLKPLSPDQFSIKDPVSITHFGKPAGMMVVVDKTIHEEDKLQVALYNSSDEQEEGKVSRKDDQSYAISFQPLQLGTYTIYVLWDKQHIVGSPFVVNNIEPPSGSEFNVESVDEEEDKGTIALKVSGPLLSFRYGELHASIKAISVDESPAPSNTPVEVSIQSHTLSVVKFVPITGMKYQLSILYDTDNILGSPFKLVSTDASQCYSEGPGLRSACTQRPNQFTVNTENAGHGELSVEICGKPDNGSDDVYVFADVSASANRIQFDISYILDLTGLYNVTVLWDRQHIPGSPFEIVCCDPSRYKVISPPQEAILGQPLKFGLAESSPPPSHEKLEVFVRGQDRMNHQGDVSRGDDENLLGTVQPPELGKYVIHVLCSGFDIDGSPFKIQNLPTPVPEKVVVSGPGIANGYVGEKGSFEIDVLEAGHGFISLKVQGPKNGFKISMNQDSVKKHLIIAEYNPTYAGSYSISIMWSSMHVPNSPFTVKIDELIQTTAPRDTGVPSGRSVLYTVHI